MLSTRWQKVVVDLWKNRVRTLVVAVAIAVGVYAIGVVLNIGELVLREYRGDQDGALLASAIVQTMPFDDDLAQRVAEIPGISAAEGRHVARTKFYRDASTPADLELVAIPDFARMEVDALTPLAGKWPPGKREIILERLALDYLGVQIGDTITLELDNGVKKELTVVGTAHNPQELSPDILNSTSGYVTPETMGSLGLGEAYHELRIRVAEQPRDKEHINAVVDQVETHLEATGRRVFGRRVITESHADPFIDTIVLILSSFGLIILLLSGFLVVNAISALITQQVSQIGVMKLIGARRWQIMSLYIVTVLVYGVLAIILGIPLAIVTARLLMETLVQGLLNVMPDSYAVPLKLIAVQAAVGLLLPLLAGLVPVIKGTSITTHKALNDVGMETGAYGQGWVERALNRVQKIVALRRPLLLALRNTLRHKGRLVQTLIVLIVGTALFVSVLSVRTSVDATVASTARPTGAGCPGCGGMVSGWGNPFAPGWQRERGHAGCWGACRHNLYGATDPGWPLAGNGQERDCGQFGCCGQGARPPGGAGHAAGYRRPGIPVARRRDCADRIAGTGDLCRARGLCVHNAHPR